MDRDAWAWFMSPDFYSLYCNLCWLCSQSDIWPCGKNQFLILAKICVMCWDCASCTRPATIFKFLTTCRFIFQAHSLWPLKGAKLFGRSMVRTLGSRFSYLCQSWKCNIHFIAYDHIWLSVSNFFIFIYRSMVQKNWWASRWPQLILHHTEGTWSMGEEAGRSFRRPPVWHVWCCPLRHRVKVSNRHPGKLGSRSYWTVVN